MKIIRLLLLALSINPPVIALAAQDAKPSPRPNFVFIIADDLGISDVGCYGSTAIRTPNVDRLAAQGLRATDAHASASVCTPSRYAILTGENYWRYPKAWEGQCLVDESTPTVARTLRGAGYKTAYFGKWHLGWGVTVPGKPREHRSELDWNAPVIKPGVLEAGYDTYFGTPWSANEPPLVFMQDRAVYALEPADPIRILGPKEEKYFGYGTSKGAAAAHAARPLDHIDMIVADKVVSFIQTNKDEPFYLQFSLVSPHVPIAPAQEFKKRTKIGDYGDYVEQMDAAVGKVVDAIDAAGLAENTLVIFTSDNGAILNKTAHQAGHHSNAALLGQKTDAWEGGVNIPFIVRWPGKVPAGKTTDRLISLNDFYATACAITGAAMPAGAARDSINQLSVWTHPDAPTVRTEMTYNAITNPQVALRSGDWVYIPAQGSLGVTTDPKHAWAMQFGDIGLENSDFLPNGALKPDAPKVQLYNLAEDPGQHVNVAAKYPDKVAELDQRLREIRKIPKANSASDAN